MRNYIYILLMLFLTSSVHAELASCYARKDNIRDFSSVTESYENATSYLKITHTNNEQINFSHRQMGANFHMCHANGIAKITGTNTYTYIDKKEYWAGEPSDSGLPETAPDSERCTIVFEFSKNSVTITASQYKCNSFCGTRAGFGGTLNATTDNSQCDECNK